MRILKQSFMAFVLFFSIIILSKLLNSFLIGDKAFIIDNQDFYLALLGVVLSVLVSSLEKVSQA